jgi:N-acetylglucosamine malate deacetylase 2
VLGWTVPERVAQQLRAELGAPFDGHAENEIDLAITVDRTLQLKAVDCHFSQAVPGSVM